MRGGRAVRLESYFAVKLGQVALVPLQRARLHRPHAHHRLVIVVVLARVEAVIRQVAMVTRQVVVTVAVVAMHTCQRVVGEFILQETIAVKRKNTK